MDRLEGFAGQLASVPESVQESTFIKGLKAEIHSAVRIAEPESLVQAIRMAIKIDETRAIGGVKVGTGTRLTCWNSGVDSKGISSLTHKLVKRKEVGVGRLSV